MFNNILIAATIVAVIVIYFGSMLAVAALAKRKVNVSGVVSEVAAVVPVVDQVCTLLESLLPQPYKSMAQIIVDYIKKAVELAENLCDAGQLTADQRKAKAMELVNSMLTLEKVTVTDKIKYAISLAIDLAAILFVPHKDEKIAELAVAEVAVQ